MRELAFVFGIVAVLSGTGLLMMVPFEVTLTWASWIVATGFVIGVPTAVVYHVLLYRALSRRRLLPRGWYWRPLQLNDRLTRAERRRVMPWCWAGGAGFAIIVVGLAVLAVAMLTALVRSSA
jgi:hypothetical protein